MIYAISTLTATIIGVGMFGLPYAASKTGLGIMMIFLIFLMFLVFAVNLVYSEIIIDCPEQLQLPGYINKYLGLNWGKLNFINFLVGMYGSLLVYLIIGGEFLHSILSSLFPIPFLVSVFIFFVCGSILIYKDVKAIADTELLMLFFLLLTITVFFFASIRNMNINYLFPAQTSNYLMPYGIVLFSFWGISVLPEIREILLLDNKGKKNLKRDMKKVNLWALIITLFVYIIFIISVLGISGKITSEEALCGLSGHLSGKIIYLGYILGFLAVFTSYISTGLTIKKSFLLDYNLNSLAAALLTCLVPMLLFLMKFTNFISLVNFLGTLTCGISGFFVFILYLKMKKEKIIKKAQFNNGTIYLFIALFLLGVVTLLY